MDPNPVYKMPITMAKDAFEHYECVRKIGEGSFAFAFHVKRISDGRSFALKAIEIKYLDPEQIEKVIQEGQILAKLDH